MYKTDPHRIYLTGLSMGGQGTWCLAYRHTERFAAAVAVCGFVDSVRVDEWFFSAFLPGSRTAAVATVAEKLRSLPIRIYHGDADRVIPVEHSREIASALQRLGATAEYIEIEGGENNVWDMAYQSEEVPAWLFRQRR